MDKRLVAVCDVLGFSDLVLKRPLEEVLSGPVDFVRRAVGWAISQGGFSESPPSFDDLKSQQWIGFSWFSDTLLFYSLDDTEDGCLAVLKTVGWLLFATHTACNGQPTRIRAGLSYGEILVDEANRLYVGRALVEAARLEQNQAWSGGALSASAAERINASRNAQFPDYWVTPYEVPIKSPDKGRADFAIDWTIGIHQKFDFPWSSTANEPPHEEWMRHHDVATKWYHARKFHRDVCRRCFPHK